MDCYLIRKNLWIWLKLCKHALHFLRNLFIFNTVLYVIFPLRVIEQQLDFVLWTLDQTQDQSPGFLLVLVKWMLQKIYKSFNNLVLPLLVHHTLSILFSEKFLSSNQLCKIRLFFSSQFEILLRNRNFLSIKIFFPIFKHYFRSDSADIWQSRRCSGVSMSDVILKLVILRISITKIFVCKVIPIIFIVKQWLWDGVQTCVKEVLNKNLYIPAEKLIHSRHDLEWQVYVACLKANVVKEHHLIFNTGHFLVNLFQIIHHNSHFFLTFLK